MCWCGQNHRECAGASPCWSSYSQVHMEATKTEGAKLQSPRWQEAPPPQQGNSADGPQVSMPAGEGRGCKVPRHYAKPVRGRALSGVVTEGEALALPPGGQHPQKTSGQSSRMWRLWAGLSWFCIPWKDLRTQAPGSSLEDSGLHPGMLRFHMGSRRKLKHWP